jgi:hypothetical protein
MPMPSIGEMLGSYYAQLKVSIKRSGRIRPPKLLIDPELTRIGRLMVANQKARWAAGINANGITAKQLNRRYFFVKKAFRKIADPKRDNEMTGDLKSNFTLRRASNGVIRAQPTARLPRQKAMRAEQYDEMIGFSPPEQVLISYEFIRLVLKYANVAWQPFNGPPPPVAPGPLMLTAPDQE